MEWQNNPKIICNELDQAPKTGEYYQKTLDKMKPQIAEAMDRVTFFDDSCDENLVNWIINNYENGTLNLPFYEINKNLWNHTNERISIQLKKERKQNDWLWNIMIWAPVPLDVSKLWLIYSKKWEASVEEGEIWTFLTFEYADSWAYKVKVQQFERPESTFLMKWLWCYKELTFDEFLKEMGKKEVKNMKEDNNDNDINNKNNSMIKNLWTKLKKLVK